MHYSTITLPTVQSISARNVNLAVKMILEMCVISHNVCLDYGKATKRGKLQEYVGYYKISVFVLKNIKTSLKQAKFVQKAKLCTIKDF